MSGLALTDHLPSLYVCCVCELPINLQAGNTLKLVSCWIKATGRTVVKVEDEMYKYCHDFCLGQKPQVMESLF